MAVKIIGPHCPRPPAGAVVINTTSRSEESWSRELSPFYLGPIPLYTGGKALKMENAWQYAKVYPQHVDFNGAPSKDYWQWANQGWSSFRAERYPFGKGVKPQYLWWDDEPLGYVPARLKVYFPLYRDAVATTSAFRRLQSLAQAGDVFLWDFDGYDFAAQGMSLADALTNPGKSMGHSFVLLCMLRYGVDVTPEIVAELCKDAPSHSNPAGQLGLFD